jgi:8-oxo-dGTP pyrophosphatase MutT (NUDIX family)
MFRATSRVLLIDADGRVLMFLQYGKHRDVAPRWITPGGGVDPGESHDQAAIREVFEETGLELESVPTPFREEDFDPDQRWHPYDEGHWAWYAVRVDHFEPSRAGWTDEELADVVEWRWFTADELRTEHASPPTNGHEVEPPDLPDLLGDIVREKR